LAGLRETRQSKRLRSSLVVLLLPAAVGVPLTRFYFVHEDLPRVIRAPTSLIIAPVAIVDGVCYALGIRGIYGRPILVFLVNWMAGAVACWVVEAAKHVWRRRRVGRNGGRRVS
jgi:hypothetical protein